VAALNPGAALARPRQRAKRMRVGGLLAELLPQALRQSCTISYSPSMRSKAAVVDTVPSRALTVLTPETFDAIAALLDISREDAAELFGKIREAASSGRTAPRQTLSVDPKELLAAVPSPRVSPRAGGKEAQEDPSEAAEVFIEDFIEQLRLWTENPLSCTPGEGPLGGSACVREAVAPARAAISALKAELRPPSPAKPAQDRETSASRVSGSHRPRRRAAPKHNWRPYCSSVPARPLVYGA